MKYDLGCAAKATGWTILLIGGCVIYVLALAFADDHFGKYGILYVSVAPLGAWTWYCLYRHCLTKKNQ